MKRNSIIKISPKINFEIIFVIAFCFIINACTTDVTFKVPAPDEKLVVEGYIYINQPPVILLTKNSPFYGTTNLSDLSNYFVHHAIIKVSDGIDTVQLSEINFDTAGVHIGVYTDVTSTIKGAPDKTYFLWIEAEGKKVSAVTSIPPTRALDSIYLEENVKPDKPQLVRLICRYTDPSAPGNRVRYFTKRNHEEFKPGANSVFDDKLINGTTFDFPLDRGVTDADTLSYVDYGYFNRGDTITVKWCNIDQYTFDFWRTLEFEKNSGGPFSSPIKIKSNINGGLGIWGGYNDTYQTVIAPQ